MPTLADVVRRHGPEYRRRFGAKLLPGHARAMNAIVSCRTSAMGGHLEHCGGCGQTRLVYHSCRHRACARCGGDRAARWVEHQSDLLLGVPYFHVVFTLPSQLRHHVRTHQKQLLPVLFRAAFDSLAELAADPRHLGAKIGALSVLHTWGRTLQWHPHVHLLVPGGGLTPDGEWKTCRKRKSGEPYLVPGAALSRKFWGRFMHLARQALPDVRFPNLPPGKRWVVHVEAIRQGGQRILDYLGRYIQRTALSERSIVACDAARVTFRYRDHRDGKRKLMTLRGDEFLRRYLQHVLPRGLHRVRSFGLLHPSHRPALRQLQLLLGVPPRLERPAAVDESEDDDDPPCETCGATRWVRGPRLDVPTCMKLERLLPAAPAPRARPPPIPIVH